MIVKFHKAWGAALSSVQSGAPAFERHFSASYFQYLAAHPESAATFNAAMTGWSAQVASAVVAAYDFARCGTVVDVGGGHGTLLAAIVASQPHLRGILFDLPHVTASATPLLTAAGVADRCEAVGGDFFTAVPSGDTYVLAQILHDWDDDRSRTILEHCQSAMAPDGRILVVELVLPPGNEPSLGKWLDLHMLVLLTGRERTEAEYRSLLASAGLRLTQVAPTRSGASVLEAVRAEAQPRVGDTQQAQLAAAT